VEATWALSNLATAENALVDLLLDQKVALFK